MARVTPDPDSSDQQRASRYDFQFNAKSEAHVVKHRRLSEVAVGWGNEAKQRLRDSRSASRR